MASSATAETRPISGVCPVLATPFDDDGVTRRCVGIVQPEVAHEREAIGGIEGHAMRVRPSLPIGMDAPAGVLHDVARRAQRSVGTHRENRNTPAAVVRHERG